MKSTFAVYKAADGTPRWLARSTTAYRDRDGEILSVAALDADSQRMTATKQYGPLRWWHVGMPDPANPTAPWGPGLDLGTCDFSTVIGRTRVESGTFKSAAIARAVARVAALDADSQRMTATKQYGPLRWWHVGRPDPANAAAPWGPGLDLGDCDFSMVIGRTRIESGTFKSAAIARAVARVADQLELSPGFFHPPNAPDAGGVFAQIRTFERSTVPTRYARASNLFTGLTVKESRMDVTEIERRFKAAIEALQLSPDQAAALGQQIAQTDKAAEAAGIAFKSQDAPTVYLGPDGTPGLIWGGAWVALKAATPPAPPEVVAAVEEKAPGDEAAEDPAAEGSPDDMAQDEGDFLGDMTVADFEAMLSTALAQALGPLVKALDVAGKMAGHVDELKSMMGGYAAKEAGTGAGIAALTARLAVLEGDQPSQLLGGEALAALKSAGPTAPVVPPDAPRADPDNPLATIAANLFPEIYGPRGA